MELKDAFKELERFAAARARGAVIVMDHRHSGSTTVGVDEGEEIDATAFLNGWRIKEIIEPKVLRDWTAEDAKKHVGYVFRITASPNVMCVLCPAHVGPSTKWTGCEYAAPIPGTDPSKWDWKPCKVEVPASEPVKSSFDVLAAVRDLRSTFVSRSCDHARRAQDGLDQIIQQAESAK